MSDSRFQGATPMESRGGGALRQPGVLVNSPGAEPQRGPRVPFGPREEKSLRVIRTLWCFSPWQTCQLFGFPKT